MKDETFSRFALCVSDHYNRIGFAVLCDLECKTLVYRNARTRTMLERITIAAGRQSDYAAGTDKRAALRLPGERFHSRVSACRQRRRKALPNAKNPRLHPLQAVLRELHAKWRHRTGSPRKENLLVSFEGYTSTPCRFPSHRRLSQLRPYPAAVRRAEALGHGPVRPLMLPGANPTEKTPHASTAARSCG